MELEQKIIQDLAHEKTGVDTYSTDFFRRIYFKHRTVCKWCGAGIDNRGTSKSREYHQRCLEAKSRTPSVIPLPTTNTRREE